MRRIALWAAVVVAVVAIVAELLPERAGTVITGGVATIFTLLMTEAALAARRLLGRGPSRLDDLLDTPKEAAGPGDLERLRRVFGHKVYSQAEFEHRLRPELRRVAGHRFPGVSTSEQSGLEAPGERLDLELWTALYAEESPARRWRTQDLARLLDLIEEKQTK